jgi:acyl-homoserine lactone acylase PvdQ
MVLGLNQASDWAQFKATLAGWRAPTQNITYADTETGSALAA